MRVTAQARAQAATLMVALAILCVLLYAAEGAQAAPGSVTGDGLTLSVDDTTPAPGETVTFSWTYTLAQGEDGPNFYAFGESGDAEPENLDDLNYVSCGGDFYDCAYDPEFTASTFFAQADGAPGDTNHGQATFTVSNAATDGEHISMFGTVGTVVDTHTTPRLTLTVTTPKADLAVGLTAASPLLSSTINYDVATTNNGPAAASSATITTQLPSQVTSVTSSSCTYNSSTHRETCPISGLANGATTHATFSARLGLLSIGLSLNATATRTASTPTDPVPANDSASATCTVITSLLVSC